MNEPDDLSQYDIVISEIDEAPRPTNANRHKEAITAFNITTIIFTGFAYYGWGPWTLPVLGVAWVVIHSAIKKQSLLSSFASLFGCFIMFAYGL